MPHRAWFCLMLLPLINLNGGEKRAREHGIEIGDMCTGALNAITDVPGVRVGHVTLIEGESSCMMVVATDAPLNARNLKRPAARAMLGLARTGGIAANGSGDYVIAFSTAATLRVPHVHKGTLNPPAALLRNEAMTPLILAAIEATEEAILNSLFAATDMTGHQGRTVKAMPVDKVLDLIRRHRPAK